MRIQALIVTGCFLLQLYFTALLEYIEGTCTSMQTSLRSKREIAAALPSSDANNTANATPGPSGPKARVQPRRRPVSASKYL